MDENKVLKLSLIISIIGIVVIYSMALVLEAPFVEIVDLNKNMIGEYIKVCGAVTSTHVSEKGTFFLKIKDYKELDAIFFKEFVEGLNAYDSEIGEKICIEGNLETYKGELEIIGNKFEVV